MKTTREFVGYVEGSTVTASYSHYDGYPVGLGRVLAETYPTAQHAQEIIRTRDIECHATDMEVVPFTAYGDEEAMQVSWTDFVLEVAYSDVEYAYLFVPGHGWIGTKVYHDWKDRLREAKNKKTAVREDKLRFQSVPRMVRNQDAAIHARLR